jgi:hypothetical protein
VVEATTVPAVEIRPKNARLVRRNNDMAIDRYPTPMIDQLEDGPWPSFISGIKRLRDEHPDQRINEVTNSLLGQLEHS